MPNVGDRVLAEWPQEGQWWYPGVIVSSAGSAMEVQYDDGDRATLTEAQVKPLDIRVGARVYCRWKGGGQYYPGVISSQNANAISVDYDDGDKENTTISMVRINVKDL